MHYFKDKNLGNFISFLMNISCVFLLIVINQFKNINYISHLNKCQAFGFIFGFLVNKEDPFENIYFLIDQQYKCTKIIFLQVLRNRDFRVKVDSTLFLPYILRIPCVTRQSLLDRIMFLVTAHGLEKSRHLGLIRMPSKS